MIQQNDTIIEENFNKQNEFPDFFTDISTIEIPNSSQFIWQIIKTIFTTSVIFLIVKITNFLWIKFAQFIFRG